MQAIITKYLGPTNTRPSRIKATGWRGSITIPYPHDAEHGTPTHRIAVDALLDKWEQEDKEDMPGRFSIVASGGLPANDGAYAFIIQ